jgi:hypothetical protein
LPLSFLVLAPFSFGAIARDIIRWWQVPKKDLSYLLIYGGPCHSATSPSLCHSPSCPIKRSIEILSPPHSIHPRPPLHRLSVDYLLDLCPDKTTILFTQWLIKWVNGQWGCPVRW